MTDYALAAQGDFNGDGRADLLWWVTDTGQTSEWLGTPNGGFAFPATSPATGFYPAAEGDFNGDDIPDLLWVNILTGVTSEWLGAKSGGFTPLFDVTPPAPPFQDALPGWFVAAQGRFNHDDTTDLLWRSSATGATSEWLMAPGGGVLEVIFNTPSAASSGTLFPL